MVHTQHLTKTPNSFEQATLPFGTSLDTETTNTTNKRFTSYDRSSTTNIDYAVNRHYDPHQGRFTQIDPIGMKSTSLSSPQSLNLYAYCQYDPITTYTRDANASDDAMHRRYNRWHSRFDQPDPYAGSYDLTNPQSFNRYSYVMNDPVNLVDPTGLDDECSRDPVCIVNSGSGNGSAPGAGTGNPIGRESESEGTEITQPGETGGSGGTGGGPQNPSDTGELERLLTESCVHFLNSILAELGKIRDPYSYNFRGIFRPAKDRKKISTVDLTPEQEKEGLGGAHSTISDPAFYINLDKGLFGRSDLAAGYVMIHELFHGGSSSHRGYNHTEMAQAAYNVALSNPAVMNKLKTYSTSGPPRNVDYSPGGQFTKADDWYNAGIFDAVVKVGCPIPPKYKLGAK